MSSEFSEDMTFQLKFFGKASERFFKMSQNFFWKEALIDKTNIQKKWLALLTFNSKNENTIECFNSINKIDEALYSK